MNFRQKISVNYNSILIENNDGVVINSDNNQVIKFISYKNSSNLNMSHNMSREIEDKNNMMVRSVLKIDIHNFRLDDSNNSFEKLELQDKEIQVKSRSSRMGKNATSKQSTTQIKQKLNIKTETS